MARNDSLRRGSAPGGSAPPPQPARQKQQPGRARRWFRRLMIWGLALALLVAMVLGGAVWWTARSLPAFDELKAAPVAERMIVLRARDGTELVTMGPAYGRWVSYDQIPQVMKQAMISVEDRRYASHFGVDPVGIVRSLFVRVQSGRFKQGGSTITQQLARNVFLNNSRTLDRKVREAVLAMALETQLSKEQILELYLNRVYFGGGAYGIDAASRKFFGHPATELTLPEAAIIAGLVKAPSHYSPTADAQAALDRAKVVIEVMQDDGTITAGQAAGADMRSVRLVAEKGQNSVRYFTDWVMPQLDLVLPENSEPIEVWTTLDPIMQRAATDAVQKNAPAGAQGALVSLDRDGAVLAMVGGTDYVTSNYNRSVNSVRQPGSAWKLFVYLAALEAGYTPNDRVVDEPVEIEGWSPRNSSASYAGEIDVRTAFAYSKNTVAAKIGNEVGFGTVAGMARRFGISTPVNTMPSMVLGTSEVRLIDMTRAFAAISAKGLAVEPYGIIKITSTDDKVLYSRPNRQPQVLIPPHVAAGITDLLQSAVAIGTGRAAQIGRPVAGKTGTTSSNKDGWFLGFSSGITTGVWMGRDDARPVAGLQGGHAPARAFAAYMRVAVSSRPIEKFDTEMQLPQWQLEPDDEVILSSPDEYYYVDDQGNLVETGRGKGQRDVGPGDPPVEEYPGQEVVGANPPKAANDDFLDEATGRKTGKDTSPGGR